MAAKGQTEATCNLGNTNKIADEVGERTGEENENSTTPVHQVIIKER